MFNTRYTDCLEDLHKYGFLEYLKPTKAENSDNEKDAILQKY
jgi:hypothetical protein